MSDELQGRLEQVHALVGAAMTDLAAVVVSRDVAEASRHLDDAERNIALAYEVLHL